MPELPEVETIRRQLASKITGETIVDVQVLDPLWCAPSDPCEVDRSLRGHRIERLGRRGKYLILELEGERYCVMHLRMTGNLLWAQPDDDEPPYLRVRFVLEGGAR